MGPRTRSRSTDFVSGGQYRSYYVHNGQLALVGNGYTGIAGSELNQDVTMAPPFNVPHNWTKWAATVDPLRLNGANVIEGNYRTDLNNWNPTNRSSVAYCPNGTLSIDWAQLKTKALALMNPSKPTVDLPVFIFEFKDFPRMLQQLGRVLQKKVKPSDVAGGYIAYSFGWAPLISDATKLFGLSKLINDRLRYLQSLEAGRRSKRRLGGQGPTVTSQGTYTLPGWGATPWLSANWQITEKHTYWATGKVKLLGKLPSGYEEKRWLAARAALGLNLSAASLWEALPWSWLIDYFSNIGDILDSQRGFIPHQVTQLCVMATTEVENKLSGMKPYQGITASGGTLKRVYKQRGVYIAPTASFSFDTLLSTHQQGILLSLVSSRALRSIGK